MSAGEISELNGGTRAGRLRGQPWHADYEYQVKFQQPNIYNQRAIDSE